MKGRRMVAASLAHYALIESARLNCEKLYVTYVDVAKAFPTVNRDLLFHKLCRLGASDRLVRALAALYGQAQGTVRGPDGYAAPFDISIGTREGGVESPLLYVLFVCDLIARLNAVQLEQRSPTLGGKEIRALQLADDLALLARCPEDMQKLIDEWERFCDDYHIETQIVKTKSVVFTRADDEDSAVSDDTFLTFNMVRLDAEKERVGFWDDLWFTYKRKRLKVREDFNYLGVLLHWKESAEAAWADRQATAHKAKGALLGSLFMVPFLPFKRMREIATAILGGGVSVWCRGVGSVYPESRERSRFEDQ